MKKVLLDANFLLLPFQFNVDVFGELDRLIGETYTVFTLNRTYNEALNIEDGRYRNLVQRLVDEAGIEIVSVDQPGSVDEVLLALAGEYIICTNDQGVKAALRERKFPHIYLRKQDHLEAAHLH